MPPVRWKLFAVTTMCWVQVMAHTDAQGNQDTMSMTADGWRPIIGTRQPSYYESFNENIRSEIPSTLPPTLTPPSPTHTPPPKNKPFRGSVKASNTQGRKKNVLSKHSQLNPYFALPTRGTHGPHIPLGAVTHGRPSQIGQIKKFPPSSKPFIQMSLNGKRNIKPLRIQTSTHSNRDDLYTASATSGAYTLYKQGPSNVKTRETIGLGLPGTNHYAINQPHAHIEFTSRFALPPTSESVFQQYNNPLQTFIFPKHPQTNDVNYQFQNHNDEYTRNLVPPPRLYNTKEPSSQVKETQKLNVPENVVVQVPSPFQFGKVNDGAIQVQVTKEKLHEFHNNIPASYNGEYVDYEFHSLRKPTETSKPTYEVTEGKLWQETPQFSIRPRKPTQQPKRQPAIELNVSPFLPTPYRPDAQGIFPTSPTQSDVSTIFTKLSQRQREQELITPNPFAFDVKEVSTHYPIFGKPLFDYDSHTQEISNDITTQQLEEEVVTTTRETPRIRPHRRRRPDHRHRTTTTTTTESIIEMENSQQTQENETPDSVETERPIRQRRPIRYRTSTQPSVESEEVRKVTRGRNRYRHRPADASHYEPIRTRIRPTEMPENHRMAEDYHQQTTEPSTESEEMASERSEEVYDFPSTESMELDPPETPKVIEVTTTERGPTTNLIIPENEIELTPEPIEETTTAPTTTTTTPSPHRIRGRPLKFDNSNRPRFSVKDYRQKLSQYSSTATPETYKATERTRHPSRLRRPTSTIANDEESTEPARSKFVPKEPRHSDPSESTIAEKSVKAVNTRLRPFGRHRLTVTTTTTTAPKVSIKPNLFTRRRPPMLSLRSKIYNKYKNVTEMTTTEDSEVKETTVSYEEEEEEPTTENWKKATTTTEMIVDEDETATEDVRNDPYLYSQRVSDLTSSSKNEYDTPGLFKSVSPTSRRIPNYFTIATDDPILPIEAFFPNLKDKVKDKEY